jgi:Icc protein
MGTSVFRDIRGNMASGEIRIALGQRVERNSAERDQNNALEAWPEHGFLETLLEPDTNGKKW